MISTLLLSRLSRPLKESVLIIANNKHRDEELESHQVKEWQAKIIASQNK
jgi:hypothetical protein